MPDRDDIIAVIQENMQLVLDEFDADTLDPERSMQEYGANSLDMVEIVSRTQRQLNARIARTRLQQIENIGQLADEILLALHRDQKV